eukprot:Sspe_Gene.61399::Locus_34067_Transcript_1_1_Confidence_1.000_Length_834::g.61399::m.61399
MLNRLHARRAEVSEPAHPPPPGPRIRRRQIGLFAACLVGQLVVGYAYFFLAPSPRTALTSSAFPLGAVVQVSDSVAVLQRAFGKQRLTWESSRHEATAGAFGLVVAVDDDDRTVEVDFPDMTAAAWYPAEVLVRVTKGRKVDVLHKAGSRAMKRLRHRRRDRKEWIGHDVLEEYGKNRKKIRRSPAPRAPPVVIKEVVVSAQPESTHHALDDNKALDDMGSDGVPWVLPH